MGTPVADCCGGAEAHRANYLGPQYDGIPLKLDPSDPLPYARRPKEVSESEQIQEFDFIRQLNQFTAEKFPDDESVRARIQSYELAFRMQMAVPRLSLFRMNPKARSRHTAWTRSLPKPSGNRCSPHGGWSSAVSDCPGLSRKQRRRRQLGRSFQLGNRPCETLPASRPANRRFAKGPKAAWLARGDPGRLGHRVWSNSRLTKLEWPRSPSLWILGLDGGRWRPRRHRSR